MFSGKKFSNDEEGIADTEACFKAKDQLYYQNAIEKLKDRFIALEGNYVEKYNVFFFKKIRTFEPNCYMI